MVSHLVLRAIPIYQKFRASPSNSVDKVEFQIMTTLLVRLVHIATRSAKVIAIWIKHGCRGLWCSIATLFCFNRLLIYLRSPR